MKEMLAIHELSHHFDKLAVLERISLTAGEGEVVVVVGPSGCGKTVLLRLISGLLATISGRVTTGGPIAYAFQKSPLFPWLTLRENVRLCCGDQSEAKVEEYFRLARLRGFEDKLPGMISGGMRQKVNVIRAFCSGRPLILMDEPFVSLDFPSREELRELTLALREREKKTILFVTHDIDEALQIADRILVLSPRPGRVLKELKINSPQPRDSQALRETSLYRDSFREIAATLLAGHA